MQALKKKYINIYLKFIGLLLKKGKKTKSKKILNSSLFVLSVLFKRSASLLLNQLFVQLNTFVETKIVRVRRRRFIVPFPINLNRRVYLSIKWLLIVLVKNRRRISFSKKLSKEILVILRGQKSRAMNYKNSNDLKAISNRSNVHYRW